MHWLHKLQARDKVEEILKIAGLSEEAIEKAMLYIYSDDWKTAKEIEKLLHVTRRTVDKWVAKGQIIKLVLPVKTLLREKTIGEDDDIQTKDNS